MESNNQNTILTYILREPRGDEGHLEGVGVRVQGVEAVWLHRPNHGVDRPGKLTADCGKR